MGIRKATTEAANIKFTNNTGEEDKGRWICATLTNVLDRPLHIWGIYAPTNAFQRTTWINCLEPKLRQKEGYTIIAGDFNFVMDTTLDKCGGRDTSSMCGSKYQKRWERKLNLTDVWRKRNPETIATTWTNGTQDSTQRVQT